MLESTSLRATSTRVAFDKLGHPVRAQTRPDPDSEDSASPLVVSYRPMSIWSAGTER